MAISLQLKAPMPHVHISAAPLWAFLAFWLDLYRQAMQMTREYTRIRW